MFGHTKGGSIGIVLGILLTFLAHDAQAQNGSEDVSKEAVKISFRKLPAVNFSMATATDPNKITYTLYTKNYPDKKTVLTEDTVKCQKLNRKVKTILLIHGWNADDTAPWYENAKKNYFQDGSPNIIYIDWSAYASLSFAVSAANVKPVGEFIAKFLKMSEVPSKNIHLVGHSMGGQLAGFIGKSYKNICSQKVGRITGLDPSGRMFSNKTMKKEDHLNELDADFVDVIHTDIQFYGFTKPCGHVDFYPNGGTNQPGCLDDVPTGLCNHRRCQDLFIESILTRISASEIKFTEDENYNITITPKKNPKTVIFGEHIDLQARGVYYFKTNPTKPFFNILK